MAQKMAVQYIRLYTEGSAALQPEPVYTHQDTTHLPENLKPKCQKIFVDPMAFLSIGIAICMIVMMFVGFVELKQTRHQVAVMENYVQRLEEEHARLSAEYADGYNLEEIRYNALALNMIPAEQAACVTIYVPEEPEQAIQLSLWERIGTFLTGLFA